MAMEAVKAMFRWPGLVEASGSTTPLTETPRRDEHAWKRPLPRAAPIKAASSDARGTCVPFNHLISP